MSGDYTEASEVSFTRKRYAVDDILGKYTYKGVVYY
jgi:hypothetical protein